MNTTMDLRLARHGWAPGGYMNICSSCLHTFTGAKRASSCAPCAYAEPDRVPRLPAIQVEAKFKLGDRVKINETCRYTELIGTEGVIDAMRLDRHSLKVEFSMCENWPEPGGSDGWPASELDLVVASTVTR